MAGGLSSAVALAAATVLLPCSATATVVTPTATFPSHLTGTTDAVAALLERVLPSSSKHFALSITPAMRCPGGTTAIAGTSASELTGGAGLYLRE